MKAVIGIGFGDEGKGLFTDYLTNNSETPLIVRFSGGQQAGHNVVINDKSHIFSNFGSGTLRGAPTYWSKYCCIDPVGIIKELKILKEKGIEPVLYIDGDSPVTTPYDKFHNKNNKVDINNGTCGVGVGSTFNREENFHHLSFSDIFNYWILETKLDNIKNFYGNVDLSEQMEEFILCCFDLTNKYKKTGNIKITYGIPIKTKDTIFEGSQGLLLDQHYGFFPHVSRTNTGTKNILKMVDDVDLYLVTRAYQTRHGNGPMTNTNYDIDINNYDETNIDNKYQGEFRKTILDVSLLEYGLNKDEYIRKSRNKNLVITCLDHLTEYVFTYDGDLVICDNEEEFIKKISNILNIKNIYISKSNKSENISFQLK